MKTTIFLLLFSSGLAFSQWDVMQKYNEVGKGNFYLFAKTEKDAKRIILETLQDNHFTLDLVFHKGANIFLNTGIADPLNNEYVYIIHCIRGRNNNVPGYHILCYYMENRYRYFYDVADGDGRISLIYDPGVISVNINEGKNPKKD